uniref:Uncharacterized protein n=1 Tax=Fagus sylvatica TaxID=28930 RepID=A0A2N9HGB0_FAGSY
MFGEHWFWGFIPVQVAIDYPIFGVVFHYSKLFFLKSPCHNPNRLEYSIRPLSGSLGWEQGSKPFAVPNIGCCGWS